MSSPLISFDHVDLSLGQGEARVHILKDVSFDIPDGKVVGVVGPSGSGKSTLLMTLAGLEQPDRGKIVIAGEQVTAMDEDALARFRGRNIGIIFQSFHLIPTMSALENVAMPLELAGRADAFDVARETLSSVGLADRASHYPKQLSGGEQQRVAIARALAPRPRLLIADEPTGNLDAETGDTIIQLLFRLQRSFGATLVIVTHDEGLAARCDRIIRMRSGRIESMADRIEAAQATQ